MRVRMAVCAFGLEMRTGAARVAMHTRRDRAQ